MIKKEMTLFVIVFLILMTLVASADIMQIDPGSGLPTQVKQVQDIYENNLSSTEQAGNYLKQEWGKILDKSPFIGPIIRFYNDNIAPIIDPVIFFILKVEPALSWFFALTLAFFITFVLFCYQASYFGNLWNWKVRYGIFIAGAVVVYYFEISRLVSEFLVKEISTTVRGSMYQYFIVLCIITALMFLWMISFYLRDMFFSLRETKEKYQTRKLIETFRPSIP